jgi:hypothetical protein
VTTPTWVDLAPAVEPVRSWLQTEVGKTVRFARAPSSGVPPFVVLKIVSDPRTILTLDGGIPADVTWQADCFGETPLQAQALGDKVSRAMVLTDPPTWEQAFVAYREAVGDGVSSTVSDKHFLWQTRYRWTLVGTS